MTDIIDLIDQVTAPTCGHCTKPLRPDGPSPDFCAEVCQEQWTLRCASRDVDEAAFALATGGLIPSPAEFRPQRVPQVPSIPEPHFDPLIPVTTTVHAAVSTYPDLHIRIEAPSSGGVTICIDDQADFHSRHSFNLNPPTPDSLVESCRLHRQWADERQRRPSSTHRDRWWRARRA